MNTYAVGIDFGTTNSVVSVCDPDGTTRTARFDWPAGASDTFRSILCFWQEGRKILHASGQIAADEYLKDTAESRLIQSIKTYLGSALFTETRLFNERFDLESLIARMLRDLWARASTALNLDPDPSKYTVVSGRPVKFAGADPDDKLATTRLLESYRRAGFRDVTLAYEPEGAAFWFARTAPKRTRVLVADFGGGTSDFSVVQIEDGKITPLGSHGIGIAGDILDFRLIDNLVAPQLGKGGTYTSFGKTLDIPIGYYRSFASWHLLSILKTPKVLREINDILRGADDAPAIERLLYMIEHELGFRLYGSIGATKAELSSNANATFAFTAPGIDLHAPVTRADFEHWIAGDVAAISRTVTELLSTIKLTPDDIDHVFMTGGTSFVPAVRTMIEHHFGAEKLSGGGEFTSVSAGLALIAHERMSSKARA